MSETWSAYVDVVSPDGLRALILRVSHDPDADRAELWVHAFVDGRLLGHMSAHPCPPIASPDTGDGRQQVRLALDQGRAWATVRAAEADRTVFGEGSIPLSVSVRWAVAGQQGSNLRGRDERLVRVGADLDVGGRITRIDGWGHHHTQRQAHPRFAVPFTYASLRGDDVGFVGLLAGSVRRGFGAYRAQRLDGALMTIDPPAVGRHLRVSAPGLELEGRLERTCRYWIPMGGRWRDGSIVTGTLGGLPVSGVVNDYAGPAA